MPNNTTKTHSLPIGLRVIESVWDPDSCSRIETERELDLDLAKDVASRNGNMSAYAVMLCLLQGSTVGTGGFNYRMTDAAERWAANLKEEI